MQPVLYCIWFVKLCSRTHLNTIQTYIICIHSILICSKCFQSSLSVCSLLKLVCIKEIVCDWNLFQDSFEVLWYRGRFWSNLATCRQTELLQTFTSYHPVPPSSVFLCPWFRKSGYHPPPSTVTDRVCGLCTEAARKESVWSVHPTLLFTHSFAHLQLSAFFSR